MTLTTRIIFITVVIYISLLLVFYFTEKNGSITIATIEFSTSGCFHYQESKLFLKKVNGIVVGHLETKGEPKKQVSLTDYQFKAFQEFFTELQTLKEVEGCTTIDIYKFIKQGLIIKKVDGSCNWNGFDNLLEKLFPHNDKVNVVNASSK